MPQEISPLLTRTKSLLRQYHLNARKGLGQHFLIDAEVVNASILAAELSHDDTVIEIGPGLGILTQEMAKIAQKVIAVELDSGMIKVLNRIFADKPNVSILQGDILNIDMEGVFTESNYKVVANLPYYAAAPTIRRFLEANSRPTRMVVMIQKEVADNMVAANGKMGILSVSIHLYARPTIVRYVPASCFYPSPKVDSAIVRLEVLDSPEVDTDPGIFFRVVKAGFSAPRKQLRNSLAQGLGIKPQEAERHLISAGISGRRRAETLNMEEWACLCRTLISEEPC